MIKNSANWKSVSSQKKTSLVRRRDEDWEGLNREVKIAKLRMGVYGA